jgi:hypothetical protein
MAGTVFGLGAPLLSATTPLTWGLSPYGSLGQGMNPIGMPSFAGPTAYSQQLPQHIYQLLQSLPQQLQQIQQLEYIQQQQVQQLIQLVAQQLQQTQQLGQVVGAGGFAVTPWGITPQPFGAQPAQVM